MSRDTSHGPRSMPLRTSDRGAGTRQAPCRHASHISSQDASKATDSPASTRSPGPIGLLPQEHLRFGVDERGRVAVRDGHALGRAGRPGGEDDPGVVAAQRRGRAPAPRRPGSADQAPLGDDGDDAGLGEHQLGALRRVVGVDGHVGRAGGQRGQDRHVERVAARRHPDADAVAAPDAAGGQPGDAVLDVGDQLGVGELDGAVVERRWRRGGGARCRRGCRSACAAAAPAQTTDTARGSRALDPLLSRVHATKRRRLPRGAVRCPISRVGRRLADSAAWRGVFLRHGVVITSSVVGRPVPWACRHDGGGRDLRR